jgi:predicted dithiol-disulfide oxidoreductase (DUF899 family)
MSIRFPEDSVEYRTSRERLPEQEIELRRATEAVAAARRQLPAGGTVLEDYVFQGAGTDGSGVRILMTAPGVLFQALFNFRLVSIRQL